MRRRLELYMCISLSILLVFIVVLFDDDFLTSPTALVERDQFEYAHQDKFLLDDTFDDTATIGLSEVDRFLQFDDDDRHNEGPNDQDVSNGPAGLVYTRMPSSQPTHAPSPPPTLVPSSLPSDSPSAAASSIPSILLSSLPSGTPTGKQKVLTKSNISWLLSQGHVDHL